MNWYNLSMSKVSHNEPDNHEGFVTVREAATYLHLGINSVYRLIQSRLLPSARFGSRSVRIPRKALYEYAEKSLQ